jgi:hypothetical protein
MRTRWCVRAGPSAPPAATRQCGSEPRPTAPPLHFVFIRSAAPRALGSGRPHCQHEPTGEKRRRQGWIEVPRSSACLCELFLLVAGPSFGFCFVRSTNSALNLYQRFFFVFCGRSLSEREVDNDLEK